MSLAAANTEFSHDNEMTQTQSLCIDDTPKNKQRTSVAVNVVGHFHKEEVCTALVNATNTPNIGSTHSVNPVENSRF